MSTNSTVGEGELPWHFFQSLLLYKHQGTLQLSEGKTVLKRTLLNHPFLEFVNVWYRPMQITLCRLAQEEASHSPLVFKNVDEDSQQ